MRIASLSDTLRRYASGERTFADISLRAKAFANVTLENCKFRRVSFEGAELLSTRFDSSSFQDGSFIRARAYRAVEFADCTFDRTSFDHAELAAVKFLRCDFRKVTFERAFLRGISFVECKLDDVSFRHATMRGVDFSNCLAADCTFERTLILGSDVGAFAEAAATHHYGYDITIDWRTVCRSLRAEHLEQFLLRCAIPDVFVHYLVASARAVDPGMLFKLMQSTFISYGGPDSLFARELQQHLELNGVRTFLFEKHAVPGDRLESVMHSEINKFDRVVLICSASSLTRPGVRNEIQETFDREARDGGASYLIPITLDDFVFSWSDSVGRRICARVVADFRKADVDRSIFNAAFQRLLQALRTAR